MDPRTGDFVLRRRAAATGCEPLDAGWVLERFPPAARPLAA